MEAAGWFTCSDRALIDDIAKLLGQRLQDDPLERAVLRKIMAVVDANPSLQDLFRKKVHETSLSLATLLEVRLGGERAIESRLLAELATHALTEAVVIWAADEDSALDEISVLVAAKLRSVREILS